MSKLTTCLWFDGRGEEAANFYISVFTECGQEASLGKVMRRSPSVPGETGAVLAQAFTLAGQEFLALNAGPEYTFTPAISMIVNCADQAEVDRFWDRLLDGGKPVQCGWLQDRFGVSWQITPTVLLEMARDPDTARADRVMQAMMTMVKLDVAALKQAYDGK